MEKFFKIRFIAFIAYIALQILLLVFILIISISEAVRDSGSLSFLQGLVSCGPCVLFGLINAFFANYACKKEKEIINGNCTSGGNYFHFVLFSLAYSSHLS